jgi:hypothetical protein
MIYGVDYETRTMSRLPMEPVEPEACDVALAASQRSPLAMRLG